LTAVFRLFSAAASNVRQAFQLLVSSVALCDEMAHGYAKSAFFVSIFLFSTD
jgi:hypothetical protein